MMASRAEMRPVLVMAGWLLGSTILAGLALRPAFGDAFLVTRYTGYVMPWLLAVLVPGAAAAWLTHHRALAAVAAASIAIITAAHAPLFRSKPAPPASSGFSLRVMSYNTWSRNLDVQRIARAIDRQRPDLLLVQEIRPKIFAGVVEALREASGGAEVHVAYDPQLLQGIVSRYPVEASGSMRTKGKAQRAVLRSPAGPIAIYNVHPLRRGGWHDRYSQIEALLQEDVLRETGPVILGGDFNAPDRSQLYGMVTRALHSAHDDRGFGFGFTYPAHVWLPFGAVPAVPLVRIDHIFFSEALVAIRAETLDDSGGSDHRPVLAELAPRAAEPQGVTGRALGAAARRRP
ncbi:endonuclease/exonuclease/phosphatase family protein [Anaeromyxobacter sp. SG26]|uniref:endonuclease/exonuclease/phosphatase family protein n=2 Tax=Anaeromyxobacter TaxID=161492 RepID=UPI001F59D869|nr:endonuclease/exonuclease/phosphatase family protein [Anaeromyxobacter sp. SG26]